MTIAANWVGQALPAEFHDWQALPGGTTNRLYRSPDGQQIVRLNAPTRLAFGVERAREAQLLTLIQPYAWAVKILDNQPRQGWCRMRAYAPLPAYQTASGTLALAPRWQAQLLNALHELHTVPIPSSTRPVLHFDYPQLLTQYRAALPNTAPYAPWIEDCLEQWHALPRLPPVLVHHDLHLANLCLDQEHEQLIVLDWEYAGLGCAWLDTQALISQCGLSKEQVLQLPIFSTLTTQQQDEGLHLAAQLVAGLNQLWLAVRARSF